MKSNCPPVGNEGDLKCTPPASADPVKMTISATYEGSPVAATMANSMGPNRVVNPGTTVAVDSDTRGSDRFFYVEVPPGAGSVRFATEPLAGASGDTDLFVRSGMQATRTSFDRSSITTGSSAESINLASPLPGGWYIDVSGASDYRNVGLTITIQ